MACSTILKPIVGILVGLVALAPLALPTTASAALSTRAVKLHTDAVWRRQGNDRIVIVVHGGGFHRGSWSDTWRAGLDKHFLARGYDVLAIDYELSCPVGATPLARGTGPCIGRGSAPTAIQTVARWTRFAAGRYKHVAVFGGSAGGYLAIAASDPAYVDQVVAVSPALSPAQDRLEGRGTWPTAWESAFDCTAEACDVNAAPAPRVPTRIIHAREDAVTSHEASRLYAKQYPALVTFRSDAGSCHGWCLVWGDRTHRIGL